MGGTFMQEHLGSFLLELLAAVVGAWIFNACYPSISDYRAHRSTRAAQRKIAELEMSLSSYETDFADVKLFMARIVRITTNTILSGVASFSAIIISLILETKLVLLYQVALQTQFENNGEIGSLFKMLTHYKYIMQIQNYILIFLLYIGFSTHYAGSSLNLVQPHIVFT